jgi:hypothetical protein
MINVIIGVLILGYAGWILYRFVKKSKKGACASCPINSNCTKNQCEDVNHLAKHD